MAVETYPLIVAVGAACCAAAFQVGRWLYASPNAQTFKDATRKQEIPELPKDLSQGIDFYDHALRRFSKSVGGEQPAGIMQNLNRRMSKPGVA